MLIKGMIPFPFSVKKQEHMSLWDTVKGPSPDLKGKTPFTPYNGFTLGTPVFTHYTPARQGHSAYIMGKGVLTISCKG